MPFNLKNRQIRVFISSTFTDMQCERELLIKQIFPQIRTLCRQREVEFREVDLRWGVTEEAKLDAAVQICLQEINQCHPFFIGLLGERYGNVHPPEKFQALHEVHPQLAWLKRYPDQSSVTDLEIQQAVFQSGVPVEELAKTMHFYFRDPKSADSVKYREEENSPGWQKLRQLKAKIRASGLPVTEYPNPAELSKRVLEHLTQVINRLFPEGSQPTRLEKEAWEHEVFAHSRTLAYIRRPADFQRLEEHVASEEALPLVIVGESGIGKSALLANWALDYRQRQPQAKVIFHFIGSSPYSTDVVTMLKRIMGELKQHYPLALSQEIPAAPEEVIKQFPQWLALAQGPGSRTILILDGLNQLSGDDQSLTWLPEFIPAHIRLLVSTLPEKVDRPQWPHFEVTALSEDERLQLIPTFLGVWSKALSPGRVKAIATAPQTANSLYLRVLLEELRVFGSHDQLQSKIDDYLAASSVTVLYQKVLRRWEEDYGEELVQRAFRLLWAARRGITESELVEMLPVSITTGWPYLYLAVQEALVNRGGVLNFFHDYLRQAVEGSYLATVEAQKEAHLALADYFEKQPLTARIVDEWPWQLAQAEAWERLKGCISGLPLVVQICRQRQESDLLEYWQRQEMGGFEEMERAYMSQLPERDAQWWYQTNNLLQLQLVSNIEVLGRLVPILFFAGRYSVAEKLTREISEDCLKQSTEVPLVTVAPLEQVEWLNNLAGLFESKCYYDLAEPLYRCALAICEQVLGENHSNTATSLNNLAWLLYHKGDYVQAEPLCRRALVIRERVLGENNLYTASSLYNMAELLRAKGDYVQAEPLCRRALAIYERVLGENHPYTASSLISLAELLRAKSDYVQAELLHRRALALNERVLGENNPYTASSLYNMAELLRAKGDYVQAEPLCRRALAIHERVAGENHPHTASSLISLAELLRAKGDYVQAEPLCRRALAIHERVLGENHPHTATALSHLAALLRAKGDSVQAEPLFRRALAIYERVLGENHLDTASSLISLAELLHAKGDSVQAEPLCRRALAIHERVLGENHPHTATALSHLAALLRAKGDYVQAEPLCRRALAIHERVAGENHPHTASSLISLAELLHAKGDSVQAEPLCRRALAIRERVLGENHPDTAFSLDGLAVLLHAKGDYVPAEPLSRRALAIRERVLGENHPYTALSLHNLAGLLHAKGDYVQAEPLYRQALAIRERVLGENHPDTAISLHGLAALLHTKGDYVQAEPLYRRALKILEEKLGIQHPTTVIVRNNLENCLKQMTTNLGQHEVERSDPSLSSPVAVFGTAAKPSRNAPCPCGSGKRVKECCGKVK